MTFNLVTGASGFIGGHLARSLVEQGQRVRCLVRKTSNIEHLRDLDIEFVTGDILDPGKVAAAVAGVDRVYHVAGLVAAIRSVSLDEVNTQGTANVVRACAGQSQPPVLILVSSIAAAGPSVRGQLKTEADRAIPMSRYGHSKRGGEVAAELLADRVPTTVIRPGIVFGPGDRLLLPSFRAVRLTRLHAVPGMRPPPLSFIYVSDLVELLCKAADAGRRLPTKATRSNGEGYYFACAAEHPDYSQFGRMLRQAVGRRRAAIVSFPVPMPWIIAGAQEIASRVTGKPQPLNFDKIREALAESWACSGAAAVRDLGFQPTQPLSEQLQTTAQWYRDHGWL